MNREAEVTVERMESPRTFKDIVEADLRRAARLIIKVQDEIDPQFRIATPEGDYWLAVTLPSDERERQAMLRRIGTLMAWRQAVAFTVASELVDPDGLFAVGVSHAEAHACLAAIRREPRPWDASSFGPVEWLDSRNVGEDLLSLLPRGSRTMSKVELDMLDKWFGPRGRFPAVHLPSGELRDI